VGRATDLSVRNASGNIIQFRWRDGMDACAISWQVPTRGYESRDALATDYLLAATDVPALTDMTPRALAVLRRMLETPDEARFRQHFQDVSDDRDRIAMSAVGAGTRSTWRSRTTASSGAPPA
jgi:hypothetical protein